MVALLPKTTKRMVAGVSKIWVQPVTLLNSSAGHWPKLASDAGCRPRWDKAVCDQYRKAEPQLFLLLWPSAVIGQMGTRYPSEAVGFGAGSPL